MSNSHLSPPLLAERLVARALDEEERSARLGDLEERFQYLVQERGERRARTWYRWQALLLAILAGVNNAQWSIIMFKNYVRTAFRNIQRYKGYSLINIVGLALGMACCILILLWAKDELATDRLPRQAGFPVSRPDDPALRRRGLPHLRLGPGLGAGPQSRISRSPERRPVRKRTR